MKLILFLFTILIVGCSSPNYNSPTVTKNTDTNTLSEEQRVQNLQLHKLDKLFCVGDFDGDKKMDTLFQHNYSKLNNVEIDTAPNPYKEEWEQVVDWFIKQEPDIYLTFHKSNSDTLHLGQGQGLYCFINIGDNNADGKDEIAVVKDNLDISRVNSCKIFTLSNNKWICLFEFNILEDAFDYTTDSTPVFTEIKGFLEHRNNKWFYSGYISNEGAVEEPGKTMPLNLKRCKE